MINLLDYVGILILAVVGFSFAVFLFFVSIFFRERGTDPLRKSIYECGMEAIGTPYVSPNIRFYVFALIFVVFDVEVAFVLPWAVKFKELGLQGFWAMIIFLGILTLGFVYEWKKGALKWD